MDKLLVKFANAHGIGVSFNYRGKLAGVYSPTRRLINVRAGLPPATKTAILLHELGHALMDDLPYLQDKTSKEFFADLFSVQLAGNFRASTFCAQGLETLGFYTRPDNEKQYIVSEVNKAADRVLDWLGMERVYALGDGRSR